MQVTDVLPPDPDTLASLPRHPESSRESAHGLSLLVQLKETKSWLFLLKHLHSSRATSILPLTTIFLTGGGQVGFLKPHLPSTKVLGKDGILQHAWQTLACRIVHQCSHFINEKLSLRKMSWPRSPQCDSWLRNVGSCLLLNQAA